MRSRLLLSTGLWLLVVVVVIGLAFRFGAEPVTGIVALLGVILALSPQADKIKEWWRVAKPSSAAEVTEAAASLRKNLRQQWGAEARRRRLARDEDQMAVRWQLVGRKPFPGNDLAESGSLRSLIEGYQADPEPLIVIGAAGSGKTAACLQMALELLKREEANRIPVIVQLSTWDPQGEEFRDWLVRRLKEDYRFLTAKYGATAVEELVDSHRLLPILDGLDELPAPSRKRALEILRNDPFFAQPFVATCRLGEFDEANEKNSVRARLIRLLPIAVQDVSAYLEEEFRNDIDRWQAVLAELAAQPQGPLAQVLTRPLMLFLAGTAYHDSDTQPSGLLDRNTFPTPEVLEHHLLDAFIPTVFAFGGAEGVVNAQKYLAFMAGFLESQRGAAERNALDLNWWQLHQLVPRWLFTALPVVLGPIVCWALGWLIFGLFGRPHFGMFFGLAVGVIGGVAFGLAQPQPPRQFAPRALVRNDLRLKLILPDIGLGLVGVAVGGLITGLLADVGYGLIGGLVFGLVFALGRRFTQPIAPKEPITPLRKLRDDRSAVAAAWFLGGVAGAAVGLYVALTSKTIAQSLVFSLSDGQRAALGAAVGTLLSAAALGMMVQATSAWGRFITTRFWLAQRGSTPVRLMGFLESAHELGVLRLSGASYQFRHALLQQRLAKHKPV